MQGKDLLNFQRRPVLRRVVLQFYRGYQAALEQALPREETYNYLSSLTVRLFVNCYGGGRSKSLIGVDP